MPSKLTSRLADLAAALAVSVAVFLGAVEFNWPAVDAGELAPFYAMALISPLLAGVFAGDHLPLTLGLLAALAAGLVPERRTWRLVLLSAATGVWIIHGARLAAEIAAV